MTFLGVPLHEDFDNDENIWSRGAVDRILLGFCNQMSQRRDEYICDELSNHLFQSKGGAPFGMDLAAINIQRGRDHGLPAYTSWRIPCGLSQIESWRDLEKVQKSSFQFLSKLLIPIYCRFSTWKLFKDLRPFTDTLMILICLVEV